MSDTQFEQLVRRLEAYAQKHPTQYKLKVALVAALGYAYVLAVLGLALAVGAWLMHLLKDEGSSHLSSIKLLFGLGLLAAVILRAFWVRFTPPTGYVVQRGGRASFSSSTNSRVPWVRPRFTMCSS
jgi:hypothetical protein